MPAAQSGGPSWGACAALGQSAGARHGPWRAPPPSPRTSAPPNPQSALSHVQLEDTIKDAAHHALRGPAVETLEDQALFFEDKVTPC
jgi:hypothetical protein